MDPHKAAETGDVNALLAFLNAGGDINTPGKGQLDRTPLQLAIENNRIRVIDVLIEHGANVNAQDYRKSTPLN